MEFLEKDLEDIIWDAAQDEKGRDLLSDRGLDIQGKLMRQVKLDAYGTADLVSIYIDGPRLYRQVEVVVYELKRDLIDVSTLMQACRYATGVKRFFNEKISNRSLSIEIKILLIGKRVELNGDFVLLYNMISQFCEIYTYSYGIDGIYFDYKMPSYCRSNENIENIKFSFNKSDIKEMLGFIK